MSHDKAAIKKALEERRTAQFRGRIGGGDHDPRKGVVDVINQADGVPEEHIYAVAIGPAGQELLWEIDLIGDLSPDDGHGRLPPQLHIECPFCTDTSDRRAMTVTMENHGYEIEPIPPRVEQVSGLLGRRDIIIDKLLHVRKSITCPYCRVVFSIRGGRISKA